MINYIASILIIMVLLGIGFYIGYCTAESKYLHIMTNENRRFQRILDEQISLAKRGLI